MNISKGLICPFCGAQNEARMWWAESCVVEGGRQMCSQCDKWFDVHCKITVKWTTKKPQTNKEATDEKPGA